jgi:hypothetical protein
VPQPVPEILEAVGLVTELDGTSWSERVYALGKGKRLAIRMVWPKGVKIEDVREFGGVADRVVKEIAGQ